MGLWNEIGTSIAIIINYIEQFVFPTQADCMAQRWRVRNHEGVLTRLYLRPGF